MHEGETSGYVVVSWVVRSSFMVRQFYWVFIGSFIGWLGVVLWSGRSLLAYTIPFPFLPPFWSFLGGIRLLVVLWSYSSRGSFLPLSTRLHHTLSLPSPFLMILDLWKVQLYVRRNQGQQEKEVCSRCLGKVVYVPGHREQAPCQNPLQLSTAVALMTWLLSSLLQKCQFVSLFFETAEANKASDWMYFKTSDWMIDKTSDWMVKKGRNGMKRKMRLWGEVEMPRKKQHHCLDKSPKCFFLYNSMKER